MELITKRIARSTGLKRYFTGVPCVNGHLSERYVSTGHCIDCVAHVSNDTNNLDSEIERIDRLIAALPERFVALSTDIQSKATDKIGKLDTKIAALQAERAVLLTQFNIEIASLTDKQTVIHERYATQLADLKARKAEAEDNAISRKMAVSLTAERRAALTKMVEVRVEVMPQDIEAAQALIYNYTRDIWPNVTIEDVWPSGKNIKPLFGSVYRVLLPIATRRTIEQQLNEMRNRSKPDIRTQALAHMSAKAQESSPTVTVRNVGIDDTFK